MSRRAESVEQFARDCNIGERWRIERDEESIVKIRFVEFLWKQQSEVVLVARFTEAEMARCLREPHLRQLAIDQCRARWDRYVRSAEARVMKYGGPS